MTNSFYSLLTILLKNYGEISKLVDSIFFSRNTGSAMVSIKFAAGDRVRVHCACSCVWPRLKGLHDCFLHLKKDRNPPIASRRLTFWTLCFFLRCPLLWKQKCQLFFLSSRGKFLRSCAVAKNAGVQASGFSTGCLTCVTCIWVRRYPEYWRNLLEKEAMG